MSNYKSRTLLLVTTAIATTFTLGKSIVHPGAISPPATNYTFPESVTLSQWKQLISNRLLHPLPSNGVKTTETEGTVGQPASLHLLQPITYISGNFIAGRRYRYRQEEKTLDIEMRYLISTNGDLKSFITSQTRELSSGLKQDREGGFYSLYVHEDKAYLSACINSRGASTITSDQFKRNRLIHDTRLERIFPWLLGRAEFRDKRCLWAHLSTPLNTDNSVEETTRTLEAAWFDWHDWWRSHFPSL